VKLADSAGRAETVIYGGYEGEDPCHIKEASWHEWNIDLQEFNDGGVDLTDVNSIAIGFGTEGDEIGGGYGFVYFDDIRVYAPRCVLSHRSAEFAKIDYAPENTGGDCVVNYQEVDIMARDWLLGDSSVDAVEPDADGLVAWYEFEFNADDDSGKGNHGTEVGFPSYTGSVAGHGNAFDFDGIETYIDCGNGASLGLTSEVTIAMWIMTRDADNGDDNPYVAKGDQSYAFKHKNSGNLEFFVYDAGGWHVVSHPVDSSFNNVWHHLAGTYDGAQLKIYVDGELAATEDYAGGIATSGDNLNIGRNSGVTDRFFEGRIDDVRIYDYALTYNEVLHTRGLGALYVPLVSPANISDDEPIGEKRVNSKDFGVLGDNWLDEDKFP